MRNKMAEIEIKKADIQNLEELSKIFDEYRIFYEKKSDIKGAKEFLFDRFVNFQTQIFIAVDKEKNLIIGFTQLYPIFSSCNTLLLLFYLNHIKSSLLHYH